LLRWAMSDNQMYRPRAQQREWGKRMAIFEGIATGIKERDL
jgi:hypothetical protein